MAQYDVRMRFTITTDEVTDPEWLADELRTELLSSNGSYTESLVDDDGKETGGEQLVNFRVSDIAECQVRRQADS